MKRLITAFLISLFMVGVLSSGVDAAARFTKVEIFEPTASTTSRQLNVEYKVLSTVESDNFTVELFENAQSKGIQSITHPYGDSGVFSINLPETGTYSYYVRAVNDGDSSTHTSDTVTVKVVNAPQPTVTTVFNSNGQGGNPEDGVFTATAGAAARSGTDGQGSVEGTDTDEDGSVTPDGASTTNDSGTDGDVQGSSDESEKDVSSNDWIYWLVLVAALVAAGAYYLIRRRRSAE